MFGTSVLQGLAGSIGSFAFVDIERHLGKDAPSSPSGSTEVACVERSYFAGLVAAVTPSTVTLAHAFRVSSYDITAPSWRVAGDDATAREPRFVTIEIKKIRNVDHLPAEMWGRVLHQYKRVRDGAAAAATADTSNGVGSSSTARRDYPPPAQGLVAFMTRVALRYALSRPTTLKAIRDCSSGALEASNETVDPQASTSVESSVATSSAAESWVASRFATKAVGREAAAERDVLAVAEAWAAGIAGATPWSPEGPAPVNIQRCAHGACIALQQCRTDATMLAQMMKAAQEEANALVEVVRDRVPGADDVAASWLAESSAAILAHAAEYHATKLSHVWAFVSVLLIATGSMAQIVWHLFHHTEGRRIVTELFDFSWWLFLSGSIVVLLAGLHALVFARGAAKPLQRRIQSAFEATAGLAAFLVMVFAWCVLVDNSALTGEPLEEFWTSAAEAGSAEVCSFMKTHHCTGYRDPCVVPAPASALTAAWLTPEQKQQPMYVLSNRSECAIVVSCFLHAYGIENGLQTASGAPLLLPARIPHTSCLVPFRTNVRAIGACMMTFSLLFACCVVGRLLAQHHVDHSHEVQLDVVFGPYRWEPQVRSITVAETPSAESTALRMESSVLLTANVVSPLDG